MIRDIIGLFSMLSAGRKAAIIFVVIFVPTVMATVTLLNEHANEICRLKGYTRSDGYFGRCMTITYEGDTK